MREIIVAVVGTIAALCILAGTFGCGVYVGMDYVESHRPAPIRECKCPQYHRPIGEPGPAGEAAGETDE